MRHLEATDGTGDAEWLATLATDVRSHPTWTRKRVRLADLSYDVADEAADTHGGVIDVPIVVVPRDGALEVIDGRHRVSAADARGRKFVTAYVPIGVRRGRP